MSVYKLSTSDIIRLLDELQERVTDMLEEKHGQSWPNDDAWESVGEQLAEVYTNLEDIVVEED